MYYCIDIIDTVYYIDIHIFQCFNYLHTLWKKNIRPQGGCPPGCTHCQAEARKPTRSTCRCVGSWGKPWSIAVPIWCAKFCWERVFFGHPCFFGEVEVDLFFLFLRLIRYQITSPVNMIPAFESGQMIPNAKTQRATLRCECRQTSSNFYLCCATLGSPKELLIGK